MINLIGKLTNAKVAELLESGRGHHLGSEQGLCQGEEGGGQRTKNWQCLGVNHLHRLAQRQDWSLTSVGKCHGEAGL